eukprot:UN26464
MITNGVVKLGTSDVGLKKGTILAYSYLGKQKYLWDCVSETHVEYYVIPDCVARDLVEKKSVREELYREIAWTFFQVVPALEDYKNTHYHGYDRSILLEEFHEDINQITIKEHRAAFIIRGKAYLEDELVNTSNYPEIITEPGTYIIKGSPKALFLFPHPPWFI